MKFSYTLLKKLAPGVRDRKKLVRELNLKFYETDDFGGDTLDIGIPPNRFSDAASHWGIAREIAAIFRLPFTTTLRRIINAPRDEGLVKIEVKDAGLCPRYFGRYFEIKKIAPSPLWLKKTLISCGLRPINNIVDVMNYGMLETGQPLHAFDADKIEGKITVRRAKKGERVETLGGKTYQLEPWMIVIADDKKPLAIAGVKGGENGSVNAKTKRIVVESANFNGQIIYKTMKKLGLQTDASLRFSHGLNPALVEIGLDRATVLLGELAGAQLKDSLDVSSYKPGRQIIEFDLARFENMTGVKIKPNEIQEYLKGLGFSILKNTKNGFQVEPPILRDDINMFEDLAEEAVRIYGLNEIPSLAPAVALAVAEYADSFKIKDQIRRILAGLGFSEVYNYTFQNKGVLALENPMSREQGYLRSSLIPSLLQNIKSNFRFFDAVKIFETGKVFGEKERESLKLGIAVAYKKPKETTLPMLELKGASDELLRRVGLMEYFFKDDGDKLRIESDHHVLGYLKLDDNSSATAEIDLDKLLKLVEEEKEYEPLPKYPAITRDISVLVGASERIGPIVQAIQETGIKYIQDVDLIDEYKSGELGRDKQSLTFRIVFQADDHTLTDDEANKEMEKVVKILKEKFRAGIR